MQAQGHPNVWFYENLEGGHGAGADNQQSAHMHAMAYDFLWDQLKLSATPCLRHRSPGTGYVPGDIFLKLPARPGKPARRGHNRPPRRHCPGICAPMMDVQTSIHHQLSLGAMAAPLQPQA
jgi:hypothetical protein